MTTDASRVIVRVSKARHICSPPGWWVRRKLDLDFGSIWECECGQRWTWGFNYAACGWERT